MTLSTTYDPLGVLKPVAPEVWIVDGPAIDFGPPGLRAPFPTRMTLVRLPQGLFVHSPTALTPALREEIAGLGTPRWLIAPNRLHYWWLPDWRTAYPGAEAFLAPGVRRQAGGRIDFPATELDGLARPPWSPQIETLGVAGDFMTEFVFFHGASRTLVLTDLIENFEAERLPSRRLRWLTRLGRAQAPDGQTPLDMRLTYWRRRRQVRAAAEKMIAWAPERVIIAHGRWFERDGTQELRRALRWVLKA